MQCKSLLINVPIKEFENYESIDDASTSLKGQEIILTPEEEFKGHCSNLQVWFEWNYDTNLLHSNLAFPLLKKLSEVGDPIAERVFGTEIISRYLSGQPTVMEFLKNEGYLNFVRDFQVEPLLETMHSPEEIKLVIDLIKGQKLLIKAYIKLIDVDPINKDAFIILSSLYIDTKKFEKALEVLKTVSELYPNDIQLILKIAFVYQVSSKGSKAIETYNQVIQIDPMSLEAWEGLALVNKTLGKRNESKKALKRIKAIKLEQKKKKKNA